MTNISIVEAMSQIAREKNVDRELVVETLADALISAAKKRYGNTENYEAEIDPVSGRMEVVAHKTVVEEVEEPSLEIELEDALAIDDEAKIGSVIIEKLNFEDFGRNAIQTAKQVLIQRVREAERERIFEEFKGKAGQIESGTVQQISRGDIILNLGRAEAAIPLKEQIRRERYRQGDTIRGLIYEVLTVSRGPQVLLSRSHPDFLSKLFSIEVPEISEGIVRIHAVAREPGERAKIAVSSSDERVDPVGACVGVKGSRVQAIVRELSGERIDIVPWSDEPEIFIARAISPANVQRVIVDHRRRHSIVLVEEDQLSLAIGKYGQNSKLAVQLTGWGLDIITESEYQDRRARITEVEQEFRQIPGVSELIALSLATSGFTSIKELGESTVELLRTVPGLEEEEAAVQMKQTAEEYFTEHKEEIEAAEAAAVQAAEAAKVAAAEAEAAMRTGFATEPGPATAMPVVETEADSAAVDVATPELVAENSDSSNSDGDAESTPDAADAETAVSAEVVAADEAGPQTDSDAEEIADAVTNADAVDEVPAESEGVEESEAEAAGPEESGVAEADADQSAESEVS